MIIADQCSRTASEEKDWKVQNGPENQICSAQDAHTEQPGRSTQGSSHCVYTMVETCAHTTARHSVGPLASTHPHIQQQKF